MSSSGDINIEARTADRGAMKIHTHSSRGVFLVPASYSFVKIIGTGTCGVSGVFRNGEAETVAVTTYRVNDDEDLSNHRSIVRELQIMSQLHCDEAIRVLDVLCARVGSLADELLVASPNFNVYSIVRESADTSLHQVIHSKQELSEEHIQYFTYQLFRGLKYLHSADVVHRNLKPSNILVNKNCDLKITAFEAACQNLHEFNEGDMLWNLAREETVITRWYVSPEILVASPHLTKAVDVWGIGCVLAELISRKPLFTGKSLLDQLTKIIEVIGSPPSSELTWLARVQNQALCDRFLSFPLHNKRAWSSFMQDVTDDSTALLDACLRFDPSCRITAPEALTYAWLKELHEPDDEPSAVKPIDWSFGCINGLTERSNSRPATKKDEVLRGIYFEWEARHSSRETTDASSCPNRGGGKREAKEGEELPTQEELTAGEMTLEQYEPPQPGPGPCHGFRGATQLGWGPEMWGISISQLSQLTRHPAYTSAAEASWDGNVVGSLDMRSMVRSIIKPATEGLGVGYALKVNARCPLRAKVMVSHAWDEPYHEFITALQHSTVAGVDAVWVCAVAIYQPEDMPEVTIQRQLGESPQWGPFATVLRQALGMLAVLTSACSIYTRMWCVYEMFTAMQLGVRVSVASYDAVHVGMGSSGHSHTDILSAQCKIPVRTIDARCGPPSCPMNEDERAIRSEIQALPTGYAVVDRAVEEVRLYALLRRAPPPRGFGLSESYEKELDSVINVAARRLDLPQLATNCQCLGAEERAAYREELGKALNNRIAEMAEFARVAALDVPAEVPSVSPRG